MAKLHVFDMDGTLLRGASVEELSRHLGCYDEVNALEQAYLRGEVFDEPDWWEQILQLWADVSDSDLDAAFERAPWIGGIADVFADIADRGERSVVISQSPLFVVSKLQRWGAQATFATTVERGVAVRQEQLLSAQDKVDITRRLLSEFGLSTSDCVAYGDSTSDIELFQVLLHTVGINASPTIRALAATSYEGADLREAYHLGRELLQSGARGGERQALGGGER